MEQTIDNFLQTKAIKFYGSWSNYRKKAELEQDDTKIQEEYIKLKDTWGTEDAIIEHMTHGVPGPIDPVTLASLDLYMIGAPDGSTLHTLITEGKNFRALRAPEYPGGPPLACIWFDYEPHGWPKSQGMAKRIGTPEEHQEILRRLKGAHMTMPGSEVTLHCQSLEAMLQDVIPERAWLIEGLLKQGGAAMVYGPAGVGKSWFVHTLLLMASHGRSVAVPDGDSGINLVCAGPHESLKVVLIDGEMVVEDIAKRTRILCEALGLTYETTKEALVSIDLAQLRLAMEAQGPGFATVTPSEIDRWCGVAQEVATDTEGPIVAPVAPVIPEEPITTIDLSRIETFLKTEQDPRAIFPDLVDEAWKLRIVNFAQSTGVDVIVFDNLSTLCPSLKDENSAAELAPLNDLIVALKHIGVATIVVHHSGKGGNYRGSSNIVTTLETVVNLEAVKTEVSCPDARFKVMVEKHRAQGLPAVHDKVLRLLNGKWVVEADETGEIQKLLSLYRTGDYISQKELATAADITQSTVSKRLAKALALKLVTEAQLSEYRLAATKIRNDPAFTEEEAEVLLDI